MVLRGECEPAHLQVYALTFLHSMVTTLGMWTFAAVGMFELKEMQAWQVRALCPLLEARLVSAPCLSTPLHQDIMGSCTATNHPSCWQCLS